MYQPYWFYPPGHPIILDWFYYCDEAALSLQKNKQISVNTMGCPGGQINMAAVSVKMRFSRSALVLLYFALWLVKKSRATFSTNQKSNSNQSWLTCTRFPARGTRLHIFASGKSGSLCSLCLLWLAGVITLVLFYDTHLKTALLQLLC